MPNEKMVCCECGLRAPRTNTNYTLISRTGWRLTRVRGDSGLLVVEWRCPACWTKHKSFASASAATLWPTGR
jgi:hypothetical protein